MYLSQTAITIVLLAFLTSAVFYQTIEMKTNDVENTVELKKQAIYSDIIKSKIENNIDKIVNDVFVNTSYEIINGDRNYYTSSGSAKNDIENRIIEKLNNTAILLNYSNISITNINFNIGPHENDPTKILATYNIKIKYSKKINNVEINGYKTITENNNEIHLYNIPDPRIYKNNFYNSWSYRTEVLVHNIPNDGNNHIFYIKLNNSNFNYSKMNNSNSPVELRIVGNNDKLLPYWVQLWREGPNQNSIIWVNCSYDDLYFNNQKLKILFNSSTTTDKQNPEDTFIFFDDFNGYILTNKWNITSNYNIFNGILTVNGTNSSVYTNRTYDDNKTLVFKCNMPLINSQSIGFFDNLSNNGVGWNYEGPDFYDDFENWAGWHNYSGGIVSQSNEINYSGSHSLKKTNFNDPNGGYKLIGQNIGREYMLSGWIYRPSNWGGGAYDRIGIEDENFNGYTIRIQHNNNKIGIDRRTGGTATSLITENWNPPENQWYYFEFYIYDNGTIKLNVYNESMSLQKSISTNNNAYNTFDRVVIHGGYNYYVDNLEVKKIGVVNGIYTRINNNQRNIVPNSNQYANNYNIYTVVRNNTNAIFEILDNELNLQYNKIYLANVDTDNHPISINTLYNNNSKISLDWIFLKDNNLINTEVLYPPIVEPNYKELKNNTLGNTFYYGDTTQYNLVPDGRYSIIGIFTNATDSWGNVGYKPIIEN